MTGDDAEPRSSIDRRTVLATGGAIVAGLGGVPSVPAASAREGSASPADPLDLTWPQGGPPNRSGSVERASDGAEDREYEDERTITDDTRTVQMTVPDAWDDVDSTPIGVNPSIIAAPDLEGYLETWTTPGVEVAATTALGTDLEAILDRLVDYSDECADGGRERFHSGEFEFRAQAWYECSGGETAYLTMVGAPADGPSGDSPAGDETELDDANGGQEAAPYVLLFGAQMLTGADLDAVVTAADSIEVEPSAAGSPT